MATQFSIHDNKSWKTPFFIIWGGQSLSILGSQLVQVCPDLVSDNKNRFGNGAGNRIPGWDAAQCHSWPVHRNVG